MHKQPHKRAFYTLAGCIAALALCVAASLFLLTPAPKAQDITIPSKAHNCLTRYANRVQCELYDRYHLQLIFGS